MDDDQTRELEALEGILCDPGAEPIKLSYGLLKKNYNFFLIIWFWWVWSGLPCKVLIASQMINFTYFTILKEY
jgi:hypothetical protein